LSSCAHKLPIIARDIPVFKEVAGEYAYYFENSNDSVVLEKAIIEWLEMYKNDKHPKSDNMPWLAWQESAQKLAGIVIGTRSSQQEEGRGRLYEIIF